MRALVRNALTVLMMLAVSAAWSWPLILDPVHTVVSGIDTWGTIWLAGAAPGVDAGLLNAGSSWPTGQLLRRADSMLMMLALKLLPLPPRAAVAGMALLGPVLSGWAAERFAARVLGASWPSSLIAGLAYGFGGAATAAFVGGQVYTLVNPWIPLLAWSWWRACQPTGRPAHGLAAGACWAAALLTTAYVGVGATVLVVSLGAAGLLGRRLRWRPMLAAAAVAVPVGLLYIAAFATGELRQSANPIRTLPVLTTMTIGSAPLSGIAGFSDIPHGAPHAEIVPLGWAVIALVAFSPVILRRERGWRVWAGVGGVGLALSLGPLLRLHQDLPGGLPWLLFPLADSSAGHWLRFPSRFMWLASLGLGAVAARAASVLAVRLPWQAGALILAAIIDAVLVTGNAARTTPIASDAPAAYAALPTDSVVLDLFPTTAGLPVDYELRQADLTCSWQAQHGHTIATRCLDTELQDDPRAQVSGWLHDALLTGVKPDRIRDHLAALGFSAVALFPDDYLASDRRAVLAGLEEALGAPVATSTDAGTRLTVFAVPGAQTDRAEAEAYYRQQATRR